MTQDEPVIAIEDVAFSYDGAPVLEKVDIAIYRGDFVSLVGPNGGGKTTLLKLVLGLLVPTKGRIRVLGLAPAQARHRIGYMPQYAHVDVRFPISVADVVLMGRLGRGAMPGPYRRADVEAARQALREVDLLDHGHRPFSDLSGGQRQRALIARAIVSEPEIIMLDEPTASLDVHMEEELYGLLRRLNRRMTVIVVSHDLGFVSQFVKSVVCVKGQCIIHPTSELTGDLIRTIYGSDVRMVRHDQRCAEGGHECPSS